MSRLRWPILGLALLAISGCGRSEPISKPSPAAFQPFRFTDIPIPPGFQPDATADQLASSLGGGGLRAYDATYLRHKNVKARGPEQEEPRSWYRQRLLAHGWLEVGSDEDSVSWIRELAHGSREHLRLETGRRRGSDIVRLSLLPALR